MISPIYLILGLIIISLFLSKFPKNQVSDKNVNYQPLHINIEQTTLNNQNYRQVLTTTNNMQLVIMSLLPGQDIGMEKHEHTSQFIRVEKGTGLAIIDNQQYPLSDGMIVVIPPRAHHNIINTSPTRRMQLYTIYTPPEHAVDTVQPNKDSPHQEYQGNPHDTTSYK